MSCGTTKRLLFLDQRLGELGETREPCEAADVLVGRLTFHRRSGGELACWRSRCLAEPELTEAAGAAAAAVPDAADLSGCCRRRRCCRCRFRNRNDRAGGPECLA